jgi:hypothetical protein
MNVYEFKDDDGQPVKIAGYDRVVKIEYWRHGLLWRREIYTKDTARKFSNALNNAAADAGADQ